MNEPRRRLGPAARSFLWMGALSLITLVLGGLRELVIARELRAESAADLFFRGVVVVGACRNFGTALFRARWVPIGAGTTNLALLRREIRTFAAVSAVALTALLAFAGAAQWREATVLVFAIAVVLATFGAGIRALAERAGLERRGFALEWALPVGAIAGSLLVGRGPLGPALGLAAGIALGIVVLAPTLLFGRHRAGSVAAGNDASQRTGWLLLDTIVYVNLSLVDAGLSHLFDPGGFALLSYGYMFVNAALAVPTAAATIVALRISSGGTADAHRRLRSWAIVAGTVVAGSVFAIWALLGWAPVGDAIDRAATWRVCDAIRPIVLCSIPFAALRLANTVGRQFVVANDPARLLPWDFAGVTARVGVLVFGVATLGVLASPLGLAAAELLQIPAWARVRARAGQRNGTA